jgi:hypothetical protein
MGSCKGERKGTERWEKCKLERNKNTRVDLNASELKV